MSLLPPRLIFSFTALSCLGLLGAAYFYFQLYLQLEPCPLCMAQRIAVALIGLVALVAAFHNPGVIGVRIYAFLTALAGGLGVGLAARHLYVQSLPPEEMPPCGPSFDYVVDVLPMAEIISVMVRGDGNCAEVLWRFLGINMPGWVLIWCMFFMLLMLYQLLRPLPRRKSLG